jgi:asparagine synthase (glutamine-hydrolysing)
LEFAASLPGSFKVRGFTTKYIAKRTLDRRVPREILDRKKTGFPVPYSDWMRTELRDWLLGILLDRESLARGYFERKALENLLEENLHSGRYSKEIFSLVTLELWHRAFLEKVGVTAS